MTYGRNHIYTEITRALGHSDDDVLEVATACALAHEDGIAVYTYADPSKAAMMLSSLGYLKLAKDKLIVEELKRQERDIEHQLEALRGPPNLTKTLRLQEEQRNIAESIARFEEIA